MTDKLLFNWGQVEGTIEMISIRDRYIFNLYEILTDKKIVCEFEERLLTDVREALGRRVLVYGEICRDGKSVKQVNVAKIHLRPFEEDLPGFDDIRGIFQG